MLAAVTDRYGPPEVVHIEDVPSPTPGPDELLVRVHATTVNRTDCGYRSGSPPIIRLFAGLRRPRPPILGTELAGEVVEVGGGVTAFDVGDRVFGYVERTRGAHAQYVALPEGASLATIPAGLAYEEAAPIGEGAHYVLSYLRAAQVGPGDRVLVNGSTGAIGSAAVQLLRGLGAEVTAVADTQRVPLVEALGADRVIDRNVEDFTQLDGGYDVVFDAVGTSSYGSCKRLLRPGGAFVATELGPWSQHALLAVATRWSRRRRCLFPLPRDSKEVVEQLRDLVADGTFRPVIDRRYPLEEIVDAYRYVESGHKTGNVIVTVDGSAA